MRTELKSMLRGGSSVGQIKKHALRTTVRKALVGSTRTLLSSHGTVWVGGEWSEPAGVVVTVDCAVYERWQDVPVGWLGVLPWWR